MLKLYRKRGTALKLFRYNLDSPYPSNGNTAGREERYKKEVVEPSYVINISKRNFMSKKQDAPGMRGYRTRNLNGLLRDKRNDTHIGTIEKQYDVDLNVRSDMHLGEFLKEHNIKSLNDLFNDR